MPLKIEAERQSEIGIQAAFMNLVENDGRYALKSRIGLQAPYEQPFGHHLDQRVARDRTFETSAVTDPATYRLAEQGSHASRGGARCQPPRFEHDDPPGNPAPRGVEQGKRNKRCLAGARRGDQHGIRTGFERRQ